MNSPTKITDNCANIRQDDGKLPVVAWPGCYPMLYVADDGETICPDCANSTDFTTDPQADADGFRIDGAMIHWEGPTALCAHCNAEIESAYGDPDQKNTTIKLATTPSSFVTARDGYDALANDVKDSND